TVVARDSFGAEAAATIIMHVAPPPGDPHPVVDLSVTRRGGRAVVDGDNVVVIADAPLHLAANATDDDPLLYIWFAHGPGDSLTCLGATATLDWDPSTGSPPNGADVEFDIELRVWDGTTTVHQWQRLVYREPPPP